MKGNKWLIALTLGLGLTLAVLWLLAGQPDNVHANPGALYVATDGNDANDCATIATRCSTVQRAVDLAADGDTIKVAAGVYTDTDTATVGYVVALTKTVTLRGGYDSTFADPPDPNANPTILDAQRQGRVIRITGSISPIIDGFIITGGSADGLGGGYPWGDGGAGIYSLDASPLVVNNVITNNMNVGLSAGQGGGLYLQNAAASTVISGNTIISNTAPAGGGLYIYDSNVTINGNTIVENVATAAYYHGGGGGLFAYGNETITISNNVFRDNTVSPGTGGTGCGGGLHIWVNMTVNVISNTIKANIASTASSGEGGGVYFYSNGSTVVSGNTIEGNIASTASSGWGGGLYLYLNSATISSNAIVSNTATTESTASGYGGGFYIGPSTSLNFVNNIIAQNCANSEGGGVWIYGGHIYPTAGTLLHNTIADNDIGAGGEGLYIREYTTLTLIDNIVTGHTVGITNTAPVNSTVTADHTLFDGNGIDYGSGVISSNEVHGDPAFVAPVALDYHIGAGSAAIDTGVDAGVTTDIDGDPRPIGAGYDIGADEFKWYEFKWYIYLPLVVKNYTP